MPSIKVLPDNLINKIAAGEVVERPASVVKELVENSLDAGATEITIDIEQSGKRLIRIADNGCGIAKEDALTAFQRHATSKIRSEQDLEAVSTMGFRGEALSSVASVSQMRMVTAEAGAASGTVVEIEGGVVKTASDAAARTGTVLEVSHLFYNTPARLKFLKSPATEFSHILATISRLALSRPDLRFKLAHNGKTVFDLLPAGSRQDRLRQLYGGEIADNVTEFSGGRDGVLVHGLVGRPGFTRSDRTYQELFVNGRAVKNASLSHALYAAHSDLLMRDRHPVAFVFIELDPALVDVNVHPAKAEVRFRNQKQVHDLVRDVIREGVSGRSRAADSGLLAAVHGEGVREALQVYAARQAVAPEGGPAASAFFGRRRRDIEGPFQGDDRGPGDRSGTVLHPSVTAADTLYPVAQVHDSFIIAQSQEGMAIIDQHAAHERVLFEKLQEQHQAGNIPVQNLLLPVPIELGPAQSVLLGDSLAPLRQLGFVVEDFGGGTFMIKAVPALLAGADHKRLLLDVLDEVTAHGSSGTLEALRDEVLSVMACHPAVKVHRQLDQQEMTALLHNLFSCRMPHTCPHGRPTVVRFSIDEIRKMFKRT